MSQKYDCHGSVGSLDFFERMFCVVQYSFYSHSVRLWIIRTAPITWPR